MKILYQVVQSSADVLDRHQSTVDELSLPQSVMQQLQKDLDASNSILPDPARRLQSWHVALLDRFDPGCESEAIFQRLDGKS